MRECMHIWKDGWIDGQTCRLMDGCMYSTHVRMYLRNYVLTQETQIKMLTDIASNQKLLHEKLVRIGLPSSLLVISIHILAITGETGEKKLSSQL